MNLFRWIYIFFCVSFFIIFLILNKLYNFINNEEKEGMVKRIGKQIKENKENEQIIMEKKQNELKHIFEQL